jgi:lipopolysaccharide biosynthesis regulator YciM
MTAIDMGQTAAGEDDLKKAADSHDSGVAALAKLALAGLYHQTGRDAQAIQLYQELIAKPTLTVPASMAKIQLAGLYETTKPAEAKRLYAEIKDQDKTTAAGQIAAQKLQGPTAQPQPQP